jgi:hypothetical protein
MVLGTKRQSLAEADQKRTGHEGCARDTAVLTREGARAAVSKLMQTEANRVVRSPVGS